MVDYTKPIAESNNFIILEKYTKYTELNNGQQSYQTEGQIEREMYQTAYSGLR